MNVGVFTTSLLLVGEVGVKAWSSWLGEWNFGHQTDYVARGENLLGCYRYGYLTSGFQPIHGVWFMGWLGTNNNNFDIFSNSYEINYNCLDRSCLPILWIICWRRMAAIFASTPTSSITRAGLVHKRPLGVSSSTVLGKCFPKLPSG